MLGTQQFETQFDHLNVLINNAGIASTPNYTFVETEDKLELVWQTNFYAPFLLTNLLMNVLRAGAEQGVKSPSRVVMISSVTHAHGRNNIDPSLGSERIGRKSKGKKKCYEYPVSLWNPLLFFLFRLYLPVYVHVFYLHNSVLSTSLFSLSSSLFSSLFFSLGDQIS